MQAIHYVLVCTAALAAGMPSFAHALPPAAQPWCTGITAGLTLLVGVLGAISPSATAGRKP